MDFYKRALEIKEDTLTDRRYLHEHAESGLELEKTRDYILRKLKEYGLCPVLCGKSVTASVGSGDPVILLRADMDALPMQEESGLEFASKTDCAHTCGHDLHAAMLLSAARMLKESEDSLRGTVHFLFQPGEETLTGARDAVESGLLETRTPKYALALHVAGGKTPPGAVYYNAGGVMMTSCDRFGILIHGKGGHASYPNLATDPIGIGGEIIQALNILCAKEATPDRLCVISVCSFHAGTTHNIIPESAELLGAMHTNDDDLRRQMRKRIEEVASGIAASFGASAEVSFPIANPPLICDKDICQTVIGGLKSLPELSLSFKDGMSANASEDFAVIAEKLPSCMLYLSAGFADERGGYFAHHPKIVFNEEALPIGSAMYAYGAILLLEKE